MCVDIFNSCWTYIGKWGREGAHEVTLSRDCGKAGIVIHELMHALGFWHEQSRPDRDEYVEIFWENIMQGILYVIIFCELGRIEFTTKFQYFYLRTVGCI